LTLSLAERERRRRKTAVQRRPWATLARPNQLPPPGDWRIWLFLAGRGTGKTRAGAEWVLAQVRSGARRIALVAPIASDARDVMVEGESGILAVAPPSERPNYEPSKRRLTFPNGAMATTYSADEPDRLRGPQHDAAWCDELAAWRYPETWDMLLLGLRLGKDPRAIVTTTPRPIAIIRGLLKDPTVAVTRGNTYENRANLAPAFFAQIVGRYEGTRIGRQEIHAELLEDVPGALWTRAELDSHRVTAFPDLQRIITAIDPSTTSGGDEAGIITAGAGVCDCKGKDALELHGFILSDSSLQTSPDGWARAAVTEYNRFHANLLVAEDNNGGEMVELTIRTIPGSPPVKRIHASHSKQARAEPVAALYEQGKIHHVGTFGALEDELCSWAPDSGQPSPNRLDAAVWAFTELGLSNSGPLFWE